jgi:SET domain-containing protein
MATYSVFRDTHEPSRHELAFFTTKAIEAGSELTFDYAGWGGGRGKATPNGRFDKCLCGSRSCRGFVPLF